MRRVYQTQSKNIKEEKSNEGETVILKLAPRSELLGPVPGLTGESEDRRNQQKERTQPQEKQA
jgi:hypothetical protein